VYMDAVNPDYLVVRLLNRHADVDVWVLPGTLLFGLFPVVGDIYYGALPYYVGLPIYAALGTGVVGIRIANLLFGLIVLAGTGFFLQAFRVRPMVSAACLAALALDPGFLFSFRTQFYITLLPCALVLSSVALVQRCRRCPSARVATVAGLLAGMSVYGYFIYAFLAPTAALHAAWRWRERQVRAKAYVWWLAGLALGGSPYLIALVLICVATGGIAGLAETLRNTFSNLSIAQSTLSLAQRVDYASSMILWTVQDVGPTQMMVGKEVSSALPILKTTVLVVVPVLALLAHLAGRARSTGILVIGGFVCGFLVLVLVFGDRLWLHHAAMLLPLLYVALALSIDVLLAKLPSSLAKMTVLLLACGPMLAVNLIDRQAVLVALDQTGGVGLSSDAIVRFSEDSRGINVPVRAFFPDWGVLMPFEMITRGTVPTRSDFTPQEAHDTLCGGRDVVLALVAGTGSDRLPKWTGELGWGRPDLATYRDRDGVPVLTVARWHSSTEQHPACRP
jgi:hypothetical protein